MKTFKTYEEYKRGSIRLRSKAGAEILAEEIAKASEELRSDYDIEGAEELDALAKSILAKDYSKYESKPVNAVESKDDKDGAEAETKEEPQF